MLILATLVAAEALPSTLTSILSPATTVTSFIVSLHVVSASEMVQVIAVSAVFFITVNV